MAVLQFPQKQEREYISCADTAKLVRRALKIVFPRTKFSVRSKTYSGGASIHIEWTDGPAEPSVDALVQRFSGADFDGMQDLKTYNDSVIDGRLVHFGADFIFCRRNIGPASIAFLETRFPGSIREYSFTWKGKTTVSHDFNNGLSIDDTREARNAWTRRSFELPSEGSESLVLPS